MFPLKSWETFRVVVPERHNAVGGDLVVGIVHGKPGEGKSDIKARAREKDLLGFFKDEHVTLEHIDR